MTTFEKSAMSAVHTALAQATSKALELFDEELFANKESNLISRGKESRKMLETFGELTFCRRRYSYQGQNIHLLDEVLGIPRNTSFSASVINFLASRTRSDSYESATRDLEELSGVKVVRASVKNAIE